MAWGCMRTLPIQLGLSFQAAAAIWHFPSPSSPSHTRRPRRPASLDLTQFRFRASVAHRSRARPTALVSLPASYGNHWTQNQARRVGRARPSIFASLTTVNTGFLLFRSMHAFVWNLGATPNVKTCFDPPYFSFLVGTVSLVSFSCTMYIHHHARSLLFRCFVSFIGASSSAHSRTATFVICKHTHRSLYSMITIPVSLAIASSLSNAATVRS